MVLAENPRFEGFSLTLPRDHWEQHGALVAQADFSRVVCVGACIHAELRSGTRFSLAEVLVLDGTAGAGRMVPERVREMCSGTILCSGKFTRECSGKAAVRGVPVVLSVNVGRAAYVRRLT